MNTFTETQAKAFETKASAEKFFSNFIWFNRYLEVIYVIPQSEFKGFKVPQWSKVTSIVAFQNCFILKLAIFNDANWLYDLDIALKHDLITFKID